MAYSTNYYTYKHIKAFKTLCDANIGDFNIQ